MLFEIYTEAICGAGAAAASTLVIAIAKQIERVIEFDNFVIGIFMELRNYRLTYETLGAGLPPTKFRQAVICLLSIRGFGLQRPVPAPLPRGVAHISSLRYRNVH